MTAPAKPDHFKTFGIVRMMPINFPLHSAFGTRLRANQFASLNGVKDCFIGVFLVIFFYFLTTITSRLRSVFIRIIPCRFLSSGTDFLAIINSVLSHLLHDFLAVCEVILTRINPTLFGVFTHRTPSVHSIPI